MTTEERPACESCAKLAEEVARLTRQLRYARRGPVAREIPRPSQLMPDLHPEQR